MQRVYDTVSKVDVAAGHKPNTISQCVSKFQGPIMTGKLVKQGVKKGEKQKTTEYVKFPRLKEVAVM